jgi:hypothetical protein
MLVGVLVGWSRRFDTAVMEIGREEVQNFIESLHLTMDA